MSLPGRPKGEYRSAQHQACVKRRPATALSINPAINPAINPEHSKGLS